MGAPHLLEQLVSGDASVQDFLSSPAAADPVSFVGPTALQAPIAAQVVRTCMSQDGVLVLVTPTTRDAEDLTAELRDLVPEARIAELPSWETLPHEKLSPSMDTVGRRLAVLRQLRHGDASGRKLDVLVTATRALLQPLIAGLGELEPLLLRVGEEHSFEQVVQSLADRGYDRTDLVTRRGEFAVRGGIIDVFVPAEQHPIRVEFFGDEVEELRWFSAADQRSLAVDELPEEERYPAQLWAPACRELLLTPQVRDQATVLAATMAADRAPRDLVEMLTRLSQGEYVVGMEALAALLSPRMEAVVELLPPQSQVLVCDPELVRRRAADLVATSEEFLAASWHGSALGDQGQAPIDLGAGSYLELAQVQEQALAQGLRWREFTSLNQDPLEENPEPGFHAMAEFRGDTEQAIAQLRTWVHDAWQVLVLLHGPGSVERIAQAFAAAELPVQRLDGHEASLDAGVVSVGLGELRDGFRHDGLKIAVLTEHDLVGQQTRGATGARRLPSRRKTTLDPLQLTPGDYVVHEHHGVGRYVEMTKRAVAGSEREYLVLAYAPAKRGGSPDMLYVPTDQLDLVTQYVGGEAPTLHRLGGADWAKTKGRARKAVRNIAGELVRLYAARMSAKGFAFSPDTPWQRELEDAFAYIETPDQLSSINEVKADMERTVPMDRLVCGDVGYGKTEIAIRAAFKAVQDGKQVAILVPTTLLVQQHSATFRERYAAFPVRLAALSRFQSEAEKKAVLAELEAGTVDVVIGTHRLLSQDVRFKDLGLVIVDEEQRFGVEHKEHLKSLRADVDMLSMSATPIPRTLEMAMTGIRQMSAIQTPPEERLPVLTAVGEYNEQQIAAAIRRELLRDGQVFFVHNRVQSIRKVAARLQELVPEARIAVAHGKLNEHELERIIVDFWEGNYDVLVATTIVESGLDIPNANTLIVDRADRFGLSQLHQIRGRVGRGRERGYAYFMYSPDQPLTETAYERLSTLASNTDLGAGMAVAMKDLEIRGAGNLLGGEQSGHIADVGFDLYLRLVSEAVEQFTKGDTEAEELPLVETKVELPLQAFIPHDYFTTEQLRLSVYRSLADAPTAEAIDDIVAELLDRYGPLPKQVEMLVAVATFRIAAKQAGLREVSVRGSQVVLAPVELPDSRQVRLQRLYPKAILKKASQTLLVPIPSSGMLGTQVIQGAELLEWLANLVRQLFAPAEQKERSLS